MLQYSKLFAPKEIAAHLAIKWTDGTSYLLTWPGPDTRPITDEFLDRQKVAAEAHAVFAFDKLLPEMDRAMKLLEGSQHPWKPVDFPWRRADVRPPQN
jgi:hypothetical protein